MTKSENVPGDYNWAHDPQRLGDEVPLDRLLGELIARTESQRDLLGDHRFVRQASRLYDRLRRSIDVHLNRYSIRRQFDLFGMYWFAAPDEFQHDFDPGLALDLGCGSENPLATVFLFIALGARRAYGVDLCDLRDPERDTRFIADLAGQMFVDPSRVFGSLPIRPEQIWENLAGFDLAGAGRGEPEALPADRFGFLQRSAADLPFGDGEAGLVVSNTFFEHVPDAAQVIEELARVTKPGGTNIHNIDCSDHRRYADPRLSPLEFLKADESLDLVAESNRLRPFEFLPLFEAAGFEIVRAEPGERCVIDPAEKARFQPKFRAMPDEELGKLQLMLTVKRR